MGASRQHLDQAKLQGLLYLSQAAWAAQNEGRKLMPATFLAAPDGPVEPNILHLFETGAPKVRARPPDVDVALFLEAMWQRFGGEAAERFGELCRGHPAYGCALDGGRDSEIVFDVHGLDTAAPRPAAQESATSGPPMTPSGKRATKWIPGQKRRAGKSGRAATDPFANDPGNPAAKFTPRRPH